jgi:hypothetical protein
MTDTIAIIFGTTFMGAILICLIWTIMSYIFNGMDTTGKRNKKLLDNMEKFPDRLSKK